jgi:O-antigen/teichoic acid export membrane protein
VSNPYKNLGGQALIYGLGNIIPRVLNYAVLTVYYTRRFPVEDYGVITELYAYVAILMVILTYGMETGLFKFSSPDSNKEDVYSSVLNTIILTSVIFALFIIILRKPAASWIGYGGNPEYIAYLGVTLSLDAICAIIFARLRIENRVRRFASIKIINVVTTIFFVFLFLEILPSIQAVANNHWYIENMRDIGVGYVFIANILASSIILILLVPDAGKLRKGINVHLLSKILAYSLPLMISGLAGIFNETIDRILLRNFSGDSVNALYELGIYGANYRIAVLMTIFIQMFRYAAEPFFFNLYGKDDSGKVYANILKYFTIFMMIIFLGVGLGIDLFKYFIDQDYHEGLAIVPVVLMANVLVGMLFNVNMWYKLSGHTMYGVYITGIGAILTIVLNIIFIPNFGYYACAWIHLITNSIMLALTWYYGRKLYPIIYDLKRIGFYVGLGILFYFAGLIVMTGYEWLNAIIGIIIVIIYFVIVNRMEDLTGIFLKKNES